MLVSFPIVWLFHCPPHSNGFDPLVWFGWCQLETDGIDRVSGCVGGMAKSRDWASRVPILAQSTLQHFSNCASPRSTSRRFNSNEMLKCARLIWIWVSISRPLISLVQFPPHCSWVKRSNFHGLPPSDSIFDRNVLISNLFIQIELSFVEIHCSFNWQFEFELIDSKFCDWLLIFFVDIWLSLPISIHFGSKLDEIWTICRHFKQKLNVTFQFQSI